jgi:hypothetical protein
VCQQVQQVEVRKVWQVDRDHAVVRRQQDTIGWLRAPTERVASVAENTQGLTLTEG